MAEFQRTVSGYAVLTKEQGDREAEDRRFFDTYDAAAEDAATFDAMITEPRLRQRWMPQRVVHVTITTTIAVQEVGADV